MNENNLHATSNQNVTITYADNNENDKTSPENGQSVCYKLPSVMLLEGTSGRNRSENSSSTVVSNVERNLNNGEKLFPICLNENDKNQANSSPDHSSISTRMDCLPPKEQYLPDRDVTNGNLCQSFSEKLKGNLITEHKVFKDHPHESSSSLSERTLQQQKFTRKRR